MVKLSPTRVIGDRTSKRTSIQATTFSLVYGTKIMVSVETTIPSARLALASEILDPNSRIYDTESLEERRRNLEKK